MNSYAVLQALYDRLRGDTGTNGLFGTPARVTGVYVVRAPATATLPYLVVDLAGMEHDDTFSTDVAVVAFRVHMFSEYTHGIGQIQGVMDRVYGDAVAQPTRVPTYGLHRHVLTPEPITGYTHSCTAIRQTDSVLLSDDPTTYHAIDGYEVRIERRA